MPLLLLRPPPPPPPSVKEEEQEEVELDSPTAATTATTKATPNSTSGVRSAGLRSAEDGARASEASSCG
jgi:hypothetical protein